ncbi:MAG: hypothetical protein AABY22_04240 [Nanoarchaeota archaeon]
MKNKNLSPKEKTKLIEHEFENFEKLIKKQLLDLKKKINRINEN